MLRILPEPLADALTALGESFTKAAAGSGDGPHGNGFSGGESGVFVDQVRCLATSDREDDSWTRRDGRHLLRNDTVAGRLALAYIVGGRRYLSADTFGLILEDVANRATARIPAGDFAQFVKLAVAEPYRDPARELPIWVTVAHKLASGKGRDYFSQEIPQLATDHDPLYAEIPPAALYSESLVPGASQPVAPTFDGYTAHLLKEVLPGADGGFSAHADALEAYVAEHLLSRLAS